MNTGLRNILIAAALIAALWFLPTSLRRNGDSSAGENGTVVVYCAHDAAFAEDVLKRFEKFSGIAVEVRFDEEASKSLGLTNQLIAERQSPRCDVFWNNQTLGTIRLQREDVLEAYVSPNAARIPDEMKDVAGHWTGFAARLRVYIFNTDKLDGPTELQVAAAMEDEDLSKRAIAVPLFGTTLSHCSLLAAEIGVPEFDAWLKSLRSRGIKQVRGNSMTRDLVAQGVCEVAFTDTDDAFSAIDKEYPVDIAPVRLPSGKTMCLPNSVAMIKGAPHPEQAKALIDFLLSEDVEVALANSSSRQIPLGPVDPDKLPEEIHRLKAWAAEGASLEAAADVHDDVMKVLSGIYLQQ